jgi:hypothetical protein
VRASGGPSLLGLPGCHTSPADPLKIVERCDTVGSVVSPHVWQHLWVVCLPASYLAPCLFWTCPALVDNLKPPIPTYVIEHMRLAGWTLLPSCPHHLPLHSLLLCLVPHKAVFITLPLPILLLLLCSKLFQFCSLLLRLTLPLPVYMSSPHRVADLLCPAHLLQ